MRVVIGPWLFYFNNWRFFHLLCSFPKLPRHRPGRMGVVVNTSLRQHIFSLGLRSFIQQCYISITSKAIVVVSLRNYIWLFRRCSGRCNCCSNWYTFHPSVEVINWRGFRDIWDRFGGFSRCSGSLLLLCLSWGWTRWGSSWSSHSGWWTFWGSNRGLCE